MVRSTLRSRDYFARLAAFGASIALGLVVGAAVYGSWRYWGEDFIAYYTAARVLLRGGNPYDFNQVIALTVQLTGRTLNNPFFYPPWALFPILPFAALDLQLARLLWLGASALGWVAAMTILGRALDWQPAPWVRYTVWLVAFVLFEWTTIKPEQYATWLLLALAVLLWAVRAQRDGVASIALLLLLTKFNVTWLAFGALFLLFWFMRRKIALGALATLIALVIFSTIATPDWWKPVIAGEIPRGWEQGLNGFEIEGGRMNTTTRDLMRYGFGLPESVGWVVAAVFALIAAYCLWHWRKNILFFTLLATSFVFMITPVAMQYDYALLAAPFVWIAKQWGEITRGARALIALGVAFIASVLVWEHWAIDGLWIALTLTMLLLISAPRVSGQMGA